MARVDEVFLVPHAGSAMPTLSIKLAKQLRAKLAMTAKLRGVTQSALVREAIEESLRPPVPSPYDQIADLIEALPAPSKSDRPTDSARNPHMGGFGLDGPALRKLRMTQRRARDRARAMRAR